MTSLRYGSGNVFVSSNAAVAYTYYAAFSAQTLQAVGVSGTGQYQYIVLITGSVYVNNAYGVGTSTSWISKGPSISWLSITTDATGQNVFAGSTGGIYVSTDFGSTFVLSSTSAFQVSGVATSGNSAYVAISVRNGYIYESGYISPSSVPSTQPTLE